MPDDSLKNKGDLNLTENVQRRSLRKRTRMNYNLKDLTYIANDITPTLRPNKRVNTGKLNKFKQLTNTAIDAALEKDIVDLTGSDAIVPVTESSSASDDDEDSEESSDETSESVSDSESDKEVIEIDDSDLDPLQREVKRILESGNDTVIDEIVPNPIKSEYPKNEVLSDTSIPEYFQSDSSESSDESSKEEITEGLNEMEMKNAFKHIRENFENVPSRKNNRIKILVNEDKISKEMKKYYAMIEDLNIDFTTDLPMHLYNIFLMNCKNDNYPPPEFTLWPMISDDVITPRNHLRTTTSNTIGPNANALPYKESRYSYINYDINNSRIKPNEQMLGYWHPEIDATQDLFECMDSVFERKINSEISKYAESHKKTQRGFPSKYIIERKDAEDIQLDDTVKTNIKNKLDNIIDNLFRMQDESIDLNEPIENKLKKHQPGRWIVPKYGFDWLNVISALDPVDKKSQKLLSRMFNIKMKKDYISGPDYPVEQILFSKARIHRDNRLKKVINGVPDSKKDFIKKTSYSNGSDIYLKQNEKMKSNLRYNLDRFTKMSIPKLPVRKFN